MRYIITLLLLCGLSSVNAQEFMTFVEKLDVAYTCLPNKAPDDFKYAFLERDSKALSDMYKLQSTALYKDNNGRDTYLTYFLSYYLFNDTIACQKAVKKFFSEESVKGLKYKEDGEAKIQPMVMIFDSESIYCMYGACATESEPWEKLKQAFIKEYAEENATLMVAKCGSVRWETVKK